MSDEATNYAAERATAQVERSRASTEAAVKRADLFAKTFATVATTGVTAFGAIKIADLFPWALSAWYDVLAVVLGFLVGMGLVLWGIFKISRRLGDAQEEPILVADLSQVSTVVADGGLTDDERARVQVVYQQFAAINGKPDVMGYIAEANEMETKADKAEVPPVSETDEANAQRWRAKAHVIHLEVLATMARAKAGIVRMRTRRALRGSFGWAVLAVAGLLLLSIITDFVDGRRTGELDAAKGCAEARALDTINEGHLPVICGDPPAEAAEDEETSADVLDSGAVAATTAWRKCLAAARKAKPPEAEETCRPLEQGVAVFLPAGQDGQ